MGRGSSKVKSGGGGATVKPINDYPEAFGNGQDFEASGDVDHRSRTVSRSLQRQWDQYAWDSGLTAAEEQSLMKEWDSRTGKLYGYIRTTNSFEINKKLYDLKNEGKSDRQIFSRKDRSGKLRDLETVRTLDKAINNGRTPADGSYTRFGSGGSIQSTFGFSDTQMSLLKSAGSMNASQLAQLNAALVGKTSMNKAYTSTSANRSMNAFSNPNNTQSRGFIFERKLNVPKGTKAYAAKRNAQESEVIFGRRLETRLTGISIAGDGHIVLHENYVGYK